MAQLKNTLIQGSARVTDTLYANELNLVNAIISGTLTLTNTQDAAGTANNSPALIVGNTVENAHLELDSNEIMAKASGTTVDSLHLNTDGGLVTIGESISTSATTTANNSTGLQIRSIRGTNQPIIRTYSYFQAASGYQWGLDHLAPNLQAGANTCILTGVANSSNNQGVLGFHYAGSNNANNYVELGLYGNNGLVKAYKDKHVEVDTLKITNTSGVAHLTFSRTDNPNYIVIPDEKHLIINNGTTVGSDKAALGIQKTQVYNAYGGSLGTSTYYWGKVYARGYLYFKAQDRYPLDMILYNKAGNQVAEMWYDCGNVDNVTTGLWNFRQFSPASTAAATTSGFKETYSLPTVTTGLTADKAYTIITTKNLSSITTVGTITSGTWQGTAIASSYIGSHNHNASNINAGTLGVARGGTGADTFTADCVIAGNGTNAMTSRGLKVTGATDANIIIQPSTSGKTLTIQTAGGAAMSVSSNGTLYLNRATNASIIFQQASTEIARFNQKNNLQLNCTDATQNNYKLIVGGNAAVTGTIAFTTAAAPTTEKLHMEYDTTTNILNFVFV